MKTKFYGIGELGTAKHSDDPKTYSIWHSLLSRCYNQNHLRFGSYGGKGIRVHKNWHTFSNFLKDLPDILGFSEKLYRANLLQLDKDKAGKKIYSIQNCIFLPKSINNAIQPNQMKKFRAVSPQQKIYLGYNKAAFCREHNLNPANVSKILNGRGKSYKGWKFSYIV